VGFRYYGILDTGIPGVVYFEYGRGVEMPKALHNKLKRQAKKKGLTGEREDAYVYGTMTNIQKAKKRRSKKR
jgi:hypothetical protein